MFTVTNSLAIAVACVALVVIAAEAQDGCRIECYPNTKVINGKGGVGKGDNCRWIVRTDGKPARLCDHIKCKKVCPANQAQDQQEAASDNSRIEQQLEADAPLANSPAAAAAGGESMGIMRQLHGSKLAKAPVPGVAGGRLSQPPQPQSAPAASSTSARRMAPTLAPSVQYDENDTPPSISRFLDISPEE